jgi:hypothetical protein
MNPNPNRPSRIKLRGELTEGREAQKARLDHFSGDAALDSTTYYSTPKKQGSVLKRAAKNTASYGMDVLKPMTPLIALGALAVGVMKANDVGTEPVNPLSLPAKELVILPVTADSPHTPAGVAGLVVNNETDVQTLSDEIATEVGGNNVASLGTGVVTVPKNQIDPAAVKQYDAEFTPKQ